MTLRTPHRIFSIVVSDYTFANFRCTSLDQIFELYCSFFSSLAFLDFVDFFSVFILFVEDDLYMIL